MEMNIGHVEVAFLTIFRASGKSSRDSHAITPIACPKRTKTLSGVGDGVVGDGGGGWVGGSWWWWVVVGGGGRGGGGGGWGWWWLWLWCW